MLVIDDDSEQLKLMSKMLVELGCDCVTLSSFDLSVDPLLRGADLLLLDMLMPTKDGIDLLEYMTSKKIYTTTYLCSGLDLEILESTARSSRAFGLNVNGIIQKPVRLEVLQKTISALQQTSNEENSVKNEVSVRSSSIVSLDAQEAIKKWWFSPVFQPQFNCRTLRVDGMECLGTMIHPVLGQVSPVIFIPVLEKQDLISEYTLMFCEQVCREIVKSCLLEHVPKFSINLSAISLNLSYCEQLISVFESNQLAVDRITFEITGSSVISDSFEATMALSKLRMYGFNLCIDDFGTGFSTILQLNEQPFNVLKIDQEFIKDIGIKKTAEAIILATSEIARELDYRLVAEGVETKEQLMYLLQHGCDIVQGCIISKPIGYEDISPKYFEKLSLQMKKVLTHI